ncbi:actin-5c-related [Anaeramoeba flamelloides]|uniref:Actin-5c-related n=1 Tax=Anaeramoeba flamelloides TaxID=1746091 RepID=A0AAV7YHB6_9EUKA|nr:actin-5c-related [Anaeramoeba flamelloides]
MNKAIVADFGRHNCKIGYSGNEAPEMTFPSVIGTPFKSRSIIGIKDEDHYVGESAMKRRSLLSLSSPIGMSSILNWDDYEHLWHYSFYNALEIVPEDYTVLVTEPASRTKFDRRKILQILFETFNVKGLVFARSGALPMFTQIESDTLTIVSIGSNVEIFPIVKNKVVDNAIVESKWNSQHVDKKLVKLISYYDNIKMFNFYENRAMIEDIKHSVCEITDCTKEEKNKSHKPLEYVLPNKRKISLCDSRYKIGEFFFNPQIGKQNIKGIHHLIIESIKKCPIHTHKTLFENILLAGGGSLFKGLSPRLKYEIEKSLESNYNKKETQNEIDSVTIKDPKNPQLLSWYGGSVFCNLNRFKRRFISKKNFQKYNDDLKIRLI